MAEQRILVITLIAVASLCGACRRTANSPASPTPAPSSATAQSASDKAIETEIVSAAPIAGVVVASGRILVPEDRTAVIGPVNEGRIVKLYAGQ
ncbi:MAG TPA: hypothetical protein VLA93_18335, partial [Pyrinomonadaceae bacterium]|nr:hypothetical protein [Pyrinomonadaceae bacterium]